MAGVNISKIDGNVTTCDQFTATGHCQRKHDNSFILTDLSLDKLYGIVICGVLDPKNLSFPNITGSPQGIAPRAEKVFVSSESKFSFVLTVMRMFRTQTNVFRLDLCNCWKCCILRRYCPYCWLHFLCARETL